MQASRRVLIFSLRNVRRQLGHTGMYELEDLVRDWEAAEVLAPGWRPAISLLDMVTSKIEKHAGLSLSLARRIQPVQVQRDYDLFFFFCPETADLALLSAVRGWRERSRLAICRLEEVWVRTLALYPDYARQCAEVLAQFDLVVIGNRYSVPRLADRLPTRRCAHVAPAVDALTFCPRSPHPPRSIDVYWMGRRVEATHRALLERARREEKYYLFDTFSGAQFVDHSLHRFQLANLIKRSRYFIANKAKADEIEEIGDQQELGYRLFEGAAGGAVIIGDPPRTEDFAEHFDWPDAAIRLPYGSSEVGALLVDLDAQPERLSRIRRYNAVNVLRRHDWVHRWEATLRQVSLESTDAMRVRKDELQRRAEEARAADWSP